MPGSIIRLPGLLSQEGEPPVVYGDGRQARDLINVRDAALITIELLERASCRLYNIGTGVANLVPEDCGDDR